MQIAICDDEPVFRAHIRKLLTQDSFEKEYDLNISEYESGEALLSALKDGVNADVLFLDIMMKGMDGMETARQLRRMGLNCLIVFLTSISSYMQEGYEVKAFRYLMKDQMDTHLKRVMEDCRRELSDRAWFTFTSDHENRSLPLSDILYLESDKRLIYLHTPLDTYRFYEKLDHLEKQLAGQGFLRCHRSFLVREACIAGWKGQKLWLKNGMELPISRTYEKDVNRRLMLRMGSL